jgi:hypothetical protein
MTACWMKGDLHVHSALDSDGFLPIEEIVRRSRPFCDFLAISGHALQSDEWGGDQYRDVLAARKKYPDTFLFHLAEWEFPIPRHVIAFTTPDWREFELQREVVRQFDRKRDVIGRAKALEALRYIETHWPDQALMIFNHPNSPAVPFEDLEALAASPVFKILACYDRGERRAPQTWEVGAEWDRLLCLGHRIWTRFGSDFHRHFEDGHTDYYPGEFVQDHLWVQERNYRGIYNAYRDGAFFCTVDNLVSRLTLVRVDQRLRVVFQCGEPVEKFEVIGDGKILMTVTNIDEHFDRELDVPPAGYYRLRGHGYEKKRRYTDGTYVPVFLSNPLFV